MRTTLDIDDDVLLAAKELARRQKKTAGEVLSELARRALTGSVAAGPGRSGGQAASFLGFQPLPSRGAVVTNELVNRIRDEVGE